MQEKNLILVGLVAMCVVSVVALVRLITVLRVYRRYRDCYYSALNSNGNSASAAAATAEAASAGGRIGFLLPSLLFHALVFLCLLVEVPVYAFRYASTFFNSDGDRLCGIGRPLYALYLLSYLFLFSACCMICFLWSEVAVFTQNVWTRLMRRQVSRGCGGPFFYSCGLCVGHAMLRFLLRLFAASITTSQNWKI